MMPLRARINKPLDVDLFVSRLFMSSVPMLILP